MTAISKQKFTISAVWKMAESLSTKGVSTIISIILARLLMPEDYGIIALTSVFINFTNILVQSGLHTSLVRKEKVDNQDYSNAFFLSFIIAAICYIFFFITAPYIAMFYKQPIISAVLRVQMLSLFLCSFGTIRNAIIIKEFRFRELCWINVIASIVGGILGIILAYCGLGVWALVLYTLLRDLLGNFILLYLVKWKPVWKLSIKRLKGLVSFSIWVLISSVLDFCGNNIYNAIFGKKYSMGELGLYSKGNQLPEMICLHTYGAITSVLLPTMANVQNNKGQLKMVCRKMVEVSAYIIFPMMTGLAMVGIRLIPVLFTSKWNSCIPILWFACIYFGINPLRSINMNLIYALGESKKALYIEMARFIMLITGVILGITILNFTIYGIAAISAFVAVCVAIMTQYYAYRKIEYHYLEWIKDMFPAIFLSGIMAIAVYVVGFIKAEDYIVLCLQVFIGVLVYIGTSVITKNKSFVEIKGLIWQILKKRRMASE